MTDLAFCSGCQRRVHPDRIAIKKRIRLPQGGATIRTWCVSCAAKIKRVETQS